MGEFSEKVFGIVRGIPRGKVSTYGQVARLIGTPRAARYVGFALRGNPEPGSETTNIPCHRVVFKDGGLCHGFAFGGLDVQREMLREEGVAFIDDTHIDMSLSAWDGLSGREQSTSETPTAPPADFDWKRELGED